MMVARLNHLARTWWPLVASLAAVAVIATMTLVSVSVAKDRQQLRDQRDQLAELVESERRLNATRGNRIADAVDQVEVAVADLIDRHHTDLATKLNNISAQLERLGARPSPGASREVVTIEPNTATTTTTATSAPEKCRGRNCRGKGPDK